MNKVHHDPQQLSPAFGVLAHLVHHPLHTPPPPNELTTQKSVLTTSTLTDSTDFNEGAKTVVSDDHKEDDPAMEYCMEDDSTM